MDEKLLIYFEDINDGTPQGSYLNEFAPKEARNGICLHLVLTWFYNYKLAGGNTAPNIIWQEMKNPTMIPNYFGGCLFCDGYFRPRQFSSSYLEGRLRRP